MTIVAAIQMTSTADVAGNLAEAGRLLGQARSRGAQVAVLPENFAFMGVSESDKFTIAEDEGLGPIQQFVASTAREMKMWIVAGTIPLRIAGEPRLAAASLVFDDHGRCVARYDKIHLFAFSQGNERYDEGKTIEPGTEVVSVDLPCGRVGLSVCYDLRFPELYRAMGPLALILVPSAFTATTGAAHWHLLLRARAVENQCYVLAAAQGGEHPGGRRTYGHSVLIDPWGLVVAELDQGPGIVIGDVDPARLATVRSELPALAHRVL